MYDIMRATEFVPNIGLTAEYPAARSEYFIAGYAVHRNLTFQVEVCNLFTKQIVYYMFHVGYAVRSDIPRSLIHEPKPVRYTRMYLIL